MGNHSRKLRPIVHNVKAEGHAHHHDAEVSSRVKPLVDTVGMLYGIVLLALTVEKPKT